MSITTTIEQSKHLLELGLGIKSADMCLCKTAQDTWFLCAGTPGEYDAHTVPAWSLSALLEVMRKLNATITLQIIGNSTFLRIKDNGFLWQKDIHVKNPMDAVYGAMLWLLEQGLIKKGEQDGQ